MPDFLLEIGLEEVPARMLAAAEAELLRRTLALCAREQLLEGEAVLGERADSFSTPRRLAVLVRGLRAEQPEVTEQLNGPAVKIAFKDGQPGPAAEAFARKAGIAVEQLERVTTPKGEYLTATVRRPGLTAAEVLGRELPKEIAALYWPKTMYWRPGKPERFVRPLEWLLALLDGEVMPLVFAGQTAGRVTRGHRLLAGEALEVGSPTSYAEQLREAWVLADVAERRQRIRKALDAATRAVAGARWREDEALVDTVTHLTEWPEVLLGSFAPEFLELPEEVLVTVMRDHQKYFAVEEAEGKLLPYFLTVVNTRLGEGNTETIRQGNERVLRARFNDARFFWQVDRRLDLMDRVAALEKLTFHKDLGSYAAKTARVLDVAQRLARAVEAAGSRVDHASLEEAATLAKADLMTELVKEFTELQGILGGLYARAEGKPETVWQAIYDQYMPAGVEGRVPRSVEGVLLGVADRADTLAGLFGLGLEPTGSKDPFALRRAANAVIKMLAEVDVPLRLDAVIGATEANEATAARMRIFFTERLSFFLREVRGFAYDVVTAVLAAGSSDVRDAVARAEAVSAMRGSAAFASVCAAFKRAKNILEQALAKGFTIEPRVDYESFEEPLDQELAQELALKVHAIANLAAGLDYPGALEAIARFGPLLDRYFEGVMVMVPEEELRAKRLGLLGQMVREFAAIADFSEIVQG